uniref:Beta-defensin n=1 Tax=Sus scrofa TaxID=9823 RepID=A0A4X1UTX7_PIG
TRPSVMFIVTLTFVSKPFLCAGRGHFKVVCECPNGSCQEFCLDSEIQVGKCLDGCVCCLPLGNVPQVDPTTPSGG